MLATFSLVTLAWVFFRNNITKSVTILKKIMTVSFSDKINTPFNHVEMWFCVFLILFLLIKERYYQNIPTKNTAAFFILFVTLSFATYFLGVFITNQFIYFQF